MSHPAGPADSTPAASLPGRRRTAPARILRSMAISLAALLLLAGGFGIYWKMQPTVSPETIVAPTTFPAIPPADSTEMKIGPGYRPWVNNYDGGKLSSQFTARQFTPVGDGNFAIDRPVWVFYLSGEQYLLLSGDSALVHVDSAGNSSSAGAIGQKQGGSSGTNGTNSLDSATISTSFMQMPSNGTLQHVVAKLFPYKLAAQPTLTLTTNNLAFDHDTFRLYTQAYTDPSGQFIAADHVPVSVRGDDYDFDGEGLSMHWDDRDRRLQLLEIEHGRELVIKHPSKLNTPMAGAATATRTEAPRGPALVDADPRGAALAIPTVAAAAKPATPPVVYQAVFNEQVRIWQGDRQMATADTMTVDFVSGGSKPAPPASPRNAPAPAAPPSDEPLDTEPEAPPAATRAAAGVSATTLPATTTSAAAEPVTVRWVGKLRLTPIDSPPILPLVSGQTVVRLVGSPVVLTPQGSTVHAAAVVYRSGDSAGRLESSPAFPIVDVTQDKGLTFHTESASYDPATAIATIIGHSDLTVPLEGAQQESLTASWTKLAKIHVLAANGTPQSVDHADMLGEVKVNHPQFNLNTDDLALDLEPAKHRPAQPTGDAAAAPLNLRRMTAIGNVHCTLPIAYQFKRGIDSDRLVIDTQTTADGQTIPQTVVADGSVRAFDSLAEDELRAGHLEAVLGPGAPAEAGGEGAGGAGGAGGAAGGDTPSVSLQSLFARSAVHATRKGGTTADADQLRLTTPGGRQHVELLGSSGAMAMVSDATRGTLRGPVILIDPDRSAVAVDGPGTLHSDRRTSATQPSQPVDVSWTHDLAVDESANTVDLHGHIIAAAVDASADHNQVTGDWVHVNLMDAPAALAPTSAPVADATTQPATQPSKPPKQIRDLAIRGHVIASSTLRSPDGATVYRQGVMDADEMDYDAVAARGLVPGPGRMLVDDHRPRAAGGAGAAAGGTDAAGNTRGTLAIQWRDSLLYDDPKSQVVFSGDVRTVFRQDQKGAGRMLLACDRLTADLTKSPPAAGSGGPTTAPARVQLSRITAAGSARFTAKDLDVTAGSIEYDPTTALLTARGTPAEPGHFIDAQGQSSGSFETVVYNVAEEKVDSESGLSGSVQH